MDLVGRGLEIAQAEELLERAASGTGGVLVLAGPPGSGRTALAGAVGAAARRHGLQVLRTAAVAGHHGRWLWAQLLRDAGAPAELAAGLLAEPGPLDLDAAAAALCAGPPRLLIAEDVDRAGPQAAELLGMLAGRAPTGPTAVLATAATPLGAGTEIWLRGLTPAQIGEVTGERRPEVRHALWVASRGLPGPALKLAAALSGHQQAAGQGEQANGPAEPADAADAPDDPVLRLALLANSDEGFLDVDAALVRLLETALRRAAGSLVRARLLARLARTLLGDAAAAARRRELSDEALALARADGSPAVLAEVLDARLHALWDPGGAADRLATAAEIIELARASGDPERERRGLFWTFVALLELGRVIEAESALAQFEREARAAGDIADLIMVTARHAVLAMIRGRFAEAERLIGQVAAEGGRAGLADTARLVGSARGMLAQLRGDQRSPDLDIEVLQDFARRIPGHFYDATVARALLAAGRPAEAALELRRALPRLLAGSGPRWLGAAADLAAVAAASAESITGGPQAGHFGKHSGSQADAAAAAAAAQLYDALVPYRQRLVVWAGANTVTGPVSHYLGILALRLGRPAEATMLLAEAAALEEEIGALPWLADTLAALARAQDQLSTTTAYAEEPVGGTAGGMAASRAADEARRHRERARQIAGQLGMTGLLEALSVPDSTWTLLRDGTDWLLTAGPERARLRDSQGLRYLRALLATPGREILALDLAAGQPGLPASAGQPVLDEAALAAYRQRLAGLEAELDEADQAGDTDRSRRAESERAAVLSELRRASGLGGRTRRVSAEDERARVNVTRTLRAALRHIAAAAPRAGAHLEASVRTGRACRYQPGPGGPSGWQV